MPFHPTAPLNNKNRLKLLNSSDSTTLSEIPVPSLSNFHIKSPKSADSSSSSIDSESENNLSWPSSSSPPPNPTH
uniref:Uncharacterized protein n=1 Tax=Arcella intermedia TaxID=1963864 RepID=A0A6B2LR17_9EUKA